MKKSSTPEAMSGEPLNDERRPIADSPREASAPLPLWAQALDACAVAVLALAVIITLSGGLRVTLAGIRVSIMSPWRVALWGVVLVVVRQVLLRERPLHRRIGLVLGQARHSEARAAAWPAFIGTRLPVLLVGYFAVVTIGYAPKAPPIRVSRNEILNLPLRFDTGWYLGIAAGGYRWRPAGGQQNIVFFPAYPLLMRVVGRFLGGAPLLAGLLISWTAFFFALVYFYRLARDELDEPRSAAAALLLLAAYPFSLFYSVVYTESLFLLGAVAAFYHLRRDELLGASAWGLLAGLTRPNGCFLSIVLAAVVLELRWRRALPHPATPIAGGRRMTARWLTAAMPGVGMLLFCAYIYGLTGNPFEWAHGHAAWGRTYRGVESLITDRYELIAAEGFYQYTASLPIDVLNGAAAVLALASIWPIWRRFGPAYALFVVVNVVPPLFAGGLLSMGRVTSVLFPLFLWLAHRVPRGRRSAWVAAFAMGQAFNASLFFTWRPLY